MQIEEAVKPVTESGPNPFTDLVAKLVVAPKTENGEIPAVKITLSADEMGAITDKKKYPGVEKVRRQLREAGAACKSDAAPKGYTIRSKVESATKTGAVVLAWSTVKVERKPKDTAASGDAAEGGAS